MEPRPARCSDVVLGERQIPSGLALLHFIQRKRILESSLRRAPPCALACWWRIGPVCSWGRLCRIGIHAFALGRLVAEHSCKDDFFAKENAPGAPAVGRRPARGRSPSHGAALEVAGAGGLLPEGVLGVQRSGAVCISPSACDSPWAWGRGKLVLAGRGQNYLDRKTVASAPVLSLTPTCCGVHAADAFPGAEAVLVPRPGA